MTGPRELNVYLTHRCNAQCPFCALTLGLTPRVKDFTVEMLDKVCDKHPSIVNVCIAGFGEPTLSRHLYPVADRARERGLGVSLITNGFLLGRHKARIVEREWLYVNVSLNAENEDEHDHRMACKEKFHGVCKGIEALAKAGVPVHASFVVGNSNFEQAIHYMRLAHSLGAQPVLVNTLPHGGDDGEIIRAGSPAARHLEDLRATGVTVLVWPTPIGDVPLWRCQSPFVSIGVDGVGFVSACRRVLAPEARFGHISDNPFYNQHFADLRSAMLTKREHDLPEPCMTCFGNWRE